MTQDIFYSTCQSGTGFLHLTPPIERTLHFEYYVQYVSTVSSVQSLSKPIHACFKLSEGTRWLFSRPCKKYIALVASFVPLGYALGPIFSTCAAYFLHSRLNSPYLCWVKIASKRFSFFLASSLLWFIWFHQNFYGRSAPTNSNTTFQFIISLETLTFVKLNALCAFFQCLVCCYLHRLLYSYEPLSLTDVQPVDITLSLLLYWNQRSTPASNSL